MEQKYWIHVFPVRNGYLCGVDDEFWLSQKRYRYKKNANSDIKKEWTLSEIDELQKLPALKNIRLRDCLEPYEPEPKEIPDFCTVVFQGASGDSWKVDYTLANIFIYENGDIRYVHRDKRTDEFGDYKIVKIWDSPDDFDLSVVEKLVKERRSYFAPDNKPIVVCNKFLGIGGEDNDEDL